MRVTDILNETYPSFSFEFSPPKTEEGLIKLFSTMELLSELNPSFVSVTYGAGGSTKGRTVEIASRIKRDLRMEPVAHLTCRGHSQLEIETILGELSDSGVQSVLALRGDPPRDGIEGSSNDFRYADELVRFVRNGKSEFCIGGACYPEGHQENPDPEDDMRRLFNKVSAGTDFLITQLFFDNRYYFEFVKRARGYGITVPIIPGIMPVTSLAQVKKITQMCGATIPPAMLDRLERFATDDQSGMAIGIEWAIRQCRELLAGGAPGIHFYTLNRSLATRVVCLSLKGEVT